MQTKSSIFKAIFIVVFFSAIWGCKKDFNSQKSSMAVNQEGTVAPANKAAEVEEKPKFNLEVVLYGERNQNGHIHFRQDPDAAKIITLDTKVHNLLPNHEYLLQRAVDAINVLDGICTSTSWLTLGHGLTPQSIVTDDKGDAEEELWRDVTAAVSGSMFDIHFRIIDKTSLEVVLTSDCYQYMIR